MTGARGQRLTADSYYEIAQDLLGTEGKDGLTIAALCQRLGVTKGSFYHHFDDLADFERQFLAFWEHEHSERIFAELASIDEPADRVTAMIEFGVSLPHATEAALRAWARGDPAVAAMVTRVDDTRTAFVVDTVIQLGVEIGQARVFARVGLDAMVGRQMRSPEVDPASMRENLEQLQAMTSVLSRPVPAAE